MDESLLALLLSALVGSLGGALVPRVISRVREPADPAEGKLAHRALATRPGLLPTALTLGLLGGALIGWGVGWDPRLVGWLLALPVLLALGFIDWHTKFLPNALMWPLILVLTPVVAGTVWLADGPGAVVPVLLCAAGSWCFHHLLWLIQASGIGFGDVRLSWVLGLLLGSAGVPALLVGVWLGFALGGVCGVLMGGLKGSLTRTIAFGPFMMLGAVLGLLSGDWVLGGLVG